MDEKESAKKPQGKERRKSLRYPPDRPLWAIFNAEDCSVEGEVNSLSETSLFLAVLRSAPIPPRGKLTLHLPDGKLLTNVKVCWARRGKGHGMKFIYTKPRDLKGLKAYCIFLEKKSSPLELRRRHSFCVSRPNKTRRAPHNLPHSCSTFAQTSETISDPWLPAWAGFGG